MQIPTEYPVFCGGRRCWCRRRKRRWFRKRIEWKWHRRWRKREQWAEFDRRVNKAVETAVGNAREKWELLTNDKLSEAEKLSKMTKEEKAQYLAQKHEKELADREASITKRELMAEAKNTLTEKKLPLGLAEILNYTDAESCKSSMAAVEKAFQEAVEAAVEEKLKGGKPPKKAGDQGDDLATQVEKIMIGY